MPIGIGTHTRPMTRRRIGEPGDRLFPIATAFTGGASPALAAGLRFGHNGRKTASDDAAAERGRIERESAGLGTLGVPRPGSSGTGIFRSFCAIRNGSISEKGNDDALAFAGGFR